MESNISKIFKRLETNSSTAETTIPSDVTTNIFNKIKELSPLIDLVTTHVTGFESFELDVTPAESIWDIQNKFLPPVGKEEKQLIQCYRLLCSSSISPQTIRDNAFNIDEYLENVIVKSIAIELEKLIILGIDSKKIPGLSNAKNPEAAKDSIKNTIMATFAAFKNINNSTCWLIDPQYIPAVTKEKELYSKSSINSKTPTLLGMPVYFVNLQGKAGIILGNFKDAYHLVRRNEFFLLQDPTSGHPYHILRYGNSFGGFANPKHFISSVF